MMPNDKSFTFIVSQKHPEPREKETTFVINQLLATIITQVSVVSGVHCSDVYSP